MITTRRVLLTALSAGAIALVAGCTGTYGYETAVYSKGYDDGYYYSQPTMVGVHDGVWAVEGRQYPVFYSSGFYWRYDNDRWYRSPYLDSGYTYVRPRVVPYSVRRIDRPRRYIRYHAPVRERVRVVPRTHIRGSVGVRHDGRRHIQRDRRHIERDRRVVHPRERRGVRQRHHRRVH